LELIDGNSTLENLKEKSQYIKRLNKLNTIIEISIEADI